MKNKFNFSLEEWSNMENPIWYRVSPFPTMTIIMETTDFSLAASFHREIETLGRIRRVDIFPILEKTKEQS